MNLFLHLLYFTVVIVGMTLVVVLVVVSSFKLSIGNVGTQISCPYEFYQFNIVLINKINIQKIIKNQLISSLN
jgi:hypothetical protein